LRRNFIFRHLEPWRINWDLIIIMFAIYNSIQLPLNIAFKPAIFSTALFMLFDNLIDICFAIDIIISFRTTYVNQYTGDEEINGVNIFKNYLFGRFSIDLLATLPFDKIIKSEKLNIKIIACLKLIRILRLGRLIKYLN
jgi:potassium channel